MSPAQGSSGGVNELDGATPTHRLSSTGRIEQQFSHHSLGLGGVAAAKQIGVVEQVVKVVKRNPTVVVTG